MAWAAGAALLLGLAFSPAVVPPPPANASYGPPVAYQPRVHGSAYADPGVLGYGAAAFHGSPTNVALDSPVVAMAPTPDGGGYWLVAADGGVFAYGDAGFYGSTGDIALDAPIVGIVPTPDGHGYWLVALDGGVFSFGDAGFHGSTGDIRLNQPVVGMAATADGGGYWLVAADGGVFSFGDAGFHGSTGDVHLDAPVVGMAATADGGGYWLVAADGGVFSFGDAAFHGSLGGQVMDGWISGMSTTPDKGGYWLVDADGRVYTFGDAVFDGDDSASPGSAPIAGIAADPAAGGYWLLEPDAFTSTFTHPGGANPVVEIAAGQVSADPDTGYFCNPYGPCEAWCALFATWVWAQAGIPIPSMAFVGSVYEWTAANSANLPPWAVPSPGDFVYYGSGPASTATAVHMGVVAQVWPDGAIITVEGDAGPGPTGGLNVVMNGPFLPSDSLTYNGFGIFGYGVP